MQLLWLHRKTKSADDCCDEFQNECSLLHTNISRHQPFLTCCLILDSSRCLSSLNLEPKFNWRKQAGERTPYLESPKPPLHCPLQPSNKSEKWAENGRIRLHVVAASVASEPSEHTRVHCTEMGAKLCPENQPKEPTTSQSVNHHKELYYIKTT